MPKTTNEYTDFKNIKHKVKHIVATDVDQASKQQILEEIREVMLKHNKKSSERPA